MSLAQLNKDIKDSSITNCSPYLNHQILETMPDILNILLIDRTLSTPSKKVNIIWANDNYISLGKDNYSARAQIKLNQITGKNNAIVMPRSLKPIEVKKERTKSKAEVFTPTWIVKLQNDIIDKNYIDDDIETYVKRTWLEITCGEAPYMVTRYDMETGQSIHIEDRVGFVDRKLSRINREIHNKNRWNKLVEMAYKSSYGFEWNGDSLLLARENMLFTYQDYYKEKWGKNPSHHALKKIAEIISYNVFQMDGLKYIIPLSEKKEDNRQLSFFNLLEEEKTTTLGIKVKIMNWDINQMEYFDKEINK